LFLLRGRREGGGTRELFSKVNKLSFAIKDVKKKRFLTGLDRKLDSPHSVKGSVISARSRVCPLIGGEASGGAYTEEGKKE